MRFFSLLLFFSLYALSGFATTKGQVETRPSPASKRDGALKTDESVVSFLRNRCFVWNPKACNSQTRAADQKLILEVKAKGSLEAAADYAMAEGWMAFVQEKDLKTALFRFNQALILQENHARSWLGAGAVYSELLMFDPGERVNKRAIELNSHEGSAYLNLGRLYAYARKDYKTAKELFLKAVEVQPDFYDSYVKLAYLSIASQDYSAARQWLGKAKRAGVNIPPQIESAVMARIPASR